MTLKAIRNSGRGKITYQNGFAANKRPFLLLRGGGTRDKDTQAFIKSYGFKFEGTRGFGNRKVHVMGWRKDNCSLSESQLILARLMHMGHEVVPTRNQRMELPVGEWSPDDHRVLPTETDKSLFRMFPIVDGQNVELLNLKKWLADAGYEDVKQMPEKPGQYAVAGGVITIYSFGTPTRLVRFELNYDTAENITQDRDGRWASISGFRLYGNGK